MCKYCEKSNNNFLLSFEKPNILPLLLGGPMETKDLFYESYSVFVDRGYLRVASDNDNQCMDHGEKIKINYCPMCGVKK